MSFETNLYDVEIKHFFEAPLGVPEVRVDRLSEKGIKRLEDLVELAVVRAKNMIVNLRHTGERATISCQHVLISTFKV